MTIGLVLVSHSARLAEGVAELAGQMAPDVPIQPAGGLPDGSLGTDYDLVSAAVERADRGDGVVLLYDLGSAQMTAELVAEADSGARKLFVADAPLVEGAVAAAVAAQGGADLDGVAAAAATAVGQAGGPEQEFAAGAAGARAEPTAEAVAEPSRSAEVVLRNQVGLHARPAALLARSIADLQAEVTVTFRGTEVDARSVLALMGLNAGGGETVTVQARGADADEAVQRILDLAERQFDE
ncbi:PTS sugar transporter subunit IIA [Longimycelium tulufanense]|uniref:Phosphocarrier protein HPr n=1 Tax=Longimycelium tulufanense TaxID=907463 RepID=A0A8J3C9J4_9PSEU|nr:dihydroxyacetone kinase phosphoryl donor subunit DhaM [Longimycelium tulufanense]GGM35450.1 PTS sugar transporter subunit IIA [Longimycelium tulufanense]